MSDREQKAIITLLVILLPVISFLAGYFANDYVDVVRGNTVSAAAPEEFDIFWEAWGHIEQNFIGETPGDKEMTYAAVRGAISALDDPYTVFLEPTLREEERISLSGNFGGIGAQFQRNEVGQVILSPIPGNPAASAGIREGDILLAIDGEPVGETLTAEEIAQRIRGTKGTQVTLTVIHLGETTPVEITIERGDILVPSVLSRPLPEDPTIGYIQLSRFSGESAGEIENAVSELIAQGAGRLILDLRGNGGGLLDAAVEIADQFIAAGPLLYQESKTEDERVYAATSNTAAPDIPLVVLVDGGTASAAEILAGALQDSGRADLIGMVTFGKGSVQLVYDLSDGSSIHVTSARWYTPARNQIDQQGLTPDILVEPTAEGIDAGRDEVLEQAIDYFNQN